MAEWAKTAMLGAVVSAFLIVVSYFALDSWRQFHVRQGLISAFHGDILAMRDIEDRRGAWLQRLEGLLTVGGRQEEGGRPWLMPEAQVPIRFIVYDANVENIGLLSPPLPERISKFYALSLRLRTEIRLLSGDRILDASRTEKRCILMIINLRVCDG